MFAETITGSDKQQYQIYMGPIAVALFLYNTNIRIYFALPYSLVRSLGLVVNYTAQHQQKNAEDPYATAHHQQLNAVRGKHDFFIKSFVVELIFLVVFVRLAVMRFDKNETKLV